VKEEKVRRERYTRGENNIQRRNKESLKYRRKETRHKEVGKPNYLRQKR
jgi:hypothetical protein